MSPLSADLQQMLSYTTKNGASFWLIAFPVEEHGFVFHKDAICYFMGDIHHLFVPAQKVLLYELSNQWFSKTSA